MEHPCWYAVYTKPRHERKVFGQLQQENIEVYLPLQTTIRKWSDRKKKISVPLFSCYIFVKIQTKEYFKVLNVPGVVRYISFEGKAIAIPEAQIRLIKNLLEQDIEVLETVEIKQVGDRVEIIAGPLTGIFGELMQFAGKKRVIIRIKEINKMLLINVPANYLKLMG